MLFRLSQLHFNDGSSVDISEADVVVIVGSNNAGKSRSLREIHDWLHRGSHSGAIVKDLSLTMSGTPSILEEWLAQHYSISYRNDQPHFETKSGLISVPDALNSWNVASGTVGRSLAPFLIAKLTAEDRFTATNYHPRTDFYGQQPSQYVNVLQRSGPRLKEIQREVQAAFAVHLELDDRWSGRDVGLRVLDSAPPEDEDRNLQFMGNQPKLAEAGDGIRSFVGTLLAVYCGSQPVLLIDEPEAFLHPPQARLLARRIAERARANGQQFLLATHSLDVLRGIIGSDVRAAIIRISRQGNINNANLLAPTALRDILSRPMLRSLTVLDGMFHEGVVLCEGDADARFYERVAQRSASEGERQKDLFFAPTYGKHQMKLVAAAYAELGVPTAVIGDIDLAEDVNETMAILRALQPQFDEGELGALRTDIEALSKSLRNLPLQASLTDLTERLEAALGELRATNQLSDEMRQRLTKTLEATRPRSEARRVGILGLRGQERTRARGILANLRHLGLFLVDRGTLESWWQEGPTSKSDWFLEAYELVSTESPARWPEELLAASEFVREVEEFFASGAQPHATAPV